MIAASVVIFIGLFVFAYWSVTPELDDHFCVGGKSPTKNIVVVVDQTDPFGKEMRNRVTLAITGALNRTKRGEMFSLFSFTGADTKGFSAIAQACSPGKREEHSSLSENLDVVGDDYAKFRNMIVEKLGIVTQDRFNLNSPYWRCSRTYPSGKSFKMHETEAN